MEGRGENREGYWSEGERQGMECGKKEIGLHGIVRRLCYVAALVVASGCSLSHPN